jgi:SAM-dependent methyltransferase
MTGEAQRFFDAIAARYDREYALPAGQSKERMRRVLERLPPPPARVLDLGVGTGREVPALLDAGYSPTGLDVSPAMLERCGRRARPIPLVQGDFWGPLPLPDASFDAAVALHGTLAHPPDVDAFSRLGEELARVVRAGGVLVAEVPAPAWLDSLARADSGGGKNLRRTGPLTCVFEDEVAAASIAARILSEDQWRTALGAAWVTEALPLGELEWLVVARRTR